MAYVTSYPELLQAGLAASLEPTDLFAEVNVLPNGDIECLGPQVSLVDGEIPMDANGEVIQDSYLVTLEEVSPESEFMDNMFSSGEDLLDMGDGGLFGLF